MCGRRISQHSYCVSHYIVVKSANTPLPTKSCHVYKVWLSALTTSSARTKDMKNPETKSQRPSLADWQKETQDGESRDQCFMAPVEIKATPLRLSLSYSVTTQWHNWLVLNFCYNISQIHGLSQIFLLFFLYCFGESKRWNPRLQPWWCNDACLPAVSSFPKFAQCSFCLILDPCLFFFNVITLSCNSFFFS